MGFLRSTKGSIISDYFQLQEDIAGFSKGYMYDVALYDDHLVNCPLCQGHFELV